MFKSIEEFKQGAEFRKKGSIVPRWVVKASKRKNQHITVFGSDCWIRRYKGYLLIACNEWYDYGIRFKERALAGTYDIKVNPYGNGKTRFIPLRTDQLEIINGVIRRIHEVGYE